MCGKYSEKEFDAVSNPLSASHFTESLQNDTINHSCKTIFIIMREFHDFEKIEFRSSQPELSLN